MTVVQVDACETDCDSLVFKDCLLGCADVTCTDRRLKTVSIQRTNDRAVVSFLDVGERQMVGPQGVAERDRTHVVAAGRTVATELHCESPVVVELETDGLCGASATAGRDCIRWHIGGRTSHILVSGILVVESQADATLQQNTHIALR